MEFKKRKIIDGHIHYAFYGYQDSLMAILDDAESRNFRSSARRIWPG